MGKEGCDLKALICNHDAVHLTFGCGLLTFLLFVMAASRKKADQEYTYGWDLFTYLLSVPVNNASFLGFYLSTVTEFCCLKYVGL